MLETITKCRGCRSSKILEVLPLQSIPIGTHFSREPNQELVYPIGLTLCEKCELVQLTQKIHRPTVFWQHLSGASIQLFDRKEVKSRISESSTFSKSGNRNIVLEIGGPSDSIEHETVSKIDQVSSSSLSQVQERVVYVHGATYSFNQFDEETVAKYLDCYGQVDEVRVDNSTKTQHPLHLSNVDDPLVYVSNLEKIVKPEGRVVIRTPYLGAIVREGFLDYVYHEHQSYFSLRSITKLFLNLGFNIFSACMCENDNLNAEFVFIKNRVAANYSLSLKKFLSVEGLLDLDKPSTYKQLGTHLKSRRKRVQQELKNMQTTTIVGYGASVATVSMMYQYQIVNFLDFLVDDDHKKIGLFCPSANLRVRKTDALYMDNVGVLVLLASRFAKEIMQRHSQFTGKVIIPTLGWSRSS